VYITALTFETMDTLNLGLCYPQPLEQMVNWAPSITILPFNLRCPSGLAVTLRQPNPNHVRPYGRD
jgi:hypothetical protein